MPSSWLKLDPDAAGALSGAFPFSFAAQPTKYASEKGTNWERHTHTARRVDRKEERRHSRQARTVFGVGLGRADRRERPPPCEWSRHAKVKLANCHISQRERDRCVVPGCTCTVDTEMRRGSRREEAKRRTEGRGGEGGGGGKEVRGGHGEEQWAKR
jgi:hypothetical protein